MSTNTTNMALGKAIDADNAKTYLETTLGGALDTLDAHRHNGSTTGLPVLTLNTGTALANVGDVRVNVTAFTYRDNAGSPANHTLGALDLAQTWTAVQTFSAQPVFSAATGIALTAAASKVVPGATSLSLRNNADTADNLILTDAGAATIRAGLIVSAGGTTIKGTPAAAGVDVTNTSTTLIIEAGSNAGANDTQCRLDFTRSSTNIGTWGFDGDVASVVAGRTKIVGDLALGVNGTKRMLMDATNGNTYWAGTINAGGIALTAAASKIVPGATSLSLRNNADTADNLLLTDAGAATFRNDVTITDTLPLLRFLETDAAANEGRWRVVTNGGNWYLQAGTDADVYTSAITVARSGGTPGLVTLNAGLTTGGAITVGAGGVALGAGNLTMTGTISTTSARVTQSYHTNITSTNAVTVDSSLRSKVPESIVDYAGDALAALRGVRVVRYRHLEALDPTGRTKLGVVAETVGEPLVLQEIDDPAGGLAYPGVNLMALAALQVRATQQIASRLAALERRVRGN